MNSQIGKKKVQIESNQNSDAQDAHDAHIIAK